MGKNIDIKAGDRFNKLTIINEIEPHIYPNGGKRRKFQCQCDCGNVTNVLLNRLSNGHTKSCGCYHIEIVTKKNCSFRKGNGQTHGHTLRDINGKVTMSRTYRSWHSMKQRCYNPRANYYNIYGGRGIKVCDSWLNSFENFLRDMGERPEKKSLDRINVNKNYEPSNCRWATAKEQANNKRR